MTTFLNYFENSSFLERWTTVLVILTLFFHWVPWAMLRATLSWKTYRTFMNKIGIKNQFLMTMWSTTRFNGYIQQIYDRLTNKKVMVSMNTITKTSKREKTWIDTFYDIGIYVAIILSITCTIILIYTLILFAQRIIGNQNIGKDEEPTMAPMQLMIPGLTVPWEDTVIIVTVILISATWHELGHAMAAINEGITIKRFGCLLFLCLPSAFVEINMEQEPLTKRGKMRIYAAGIWHNVVLLIFIGITMYLLAFPLLMKGDDPNRPLKIYHVDKRSMYATTIQQGASIEWMHAPSFPLSMTNYSNWREGLSLSPYLTYCIPERYIIDDACCDHPEMYPQQICLVGSQSKKQCAKGREVYPFVDMPKGKVENLFEFFKEQYDDLRLCSTPGTTRYRMAFAEEGEHMIAMSIENLQKPLLHVGSARDLFEAVDVTMDVSRFPLLISIHHIHFLVRFAFYMVIINLPLSIFNAIPAFGIMDGDHLFKLYTEKTTNQLIKGILSVAQRILPVLFAVTALLGLASSFL